MQTASLADRDVMQTASLAGSIRRHTLLPLNDCLYALQALHHCLTRALL
jgi:predicted nucleic acid-binding protein